jgi:hypothetical protein
MTIEALQAVDLEKVNYPTIKEYAQEILQDYEDEDDATKQEFAKQATESIQAVYKMIQANAPEAIPGNETQETDSDSDNKKADNTPKKKKKLTKEELDAFEEEIKQCRLAIKEYNAKKNEGKPKKPKKKRHEKIEGHLLSIGNLVPENLKDNLDILEKAEKILSKTGREIMKLYRMDELHIKEVEQEIKEKYQQKEQKIKKDNDE